MSLLENADRTWQDVGACRTADPNLFFLDVGESPRKALEFCSVCIVQSECLEYALTARPTITRGIWGGKTERQLRRLRQERLRARNHAAQEQARLNGDLGCLCGAPTRPEPTSKYHQRHALGGAGVPISEPCPAAYACHRLYQNRIAAKARAKKKRNLYAP